MTGKLLQRFDFHQMWGRAVAKSSGIHWKRGYFGRLKTHTRVICYAAPKWEPLRRIVGSWRHLTCTYMTEHDAYMYASSSTPIRGPLYS